MDEKFLFNSSWNQIGNLNKIANYSIFKVTNGQFSMKNQTALGIEFDHEVG